MGMMGPGGPAWGGRQPGVSLTMDQAISAAQGYVSRLGNPDLALDEAIFLAQSLFEVNADFFIQRVVPKLGEAVSRIGSQLLSTDHGPTPASA